MAETGTLETCEWRARLALRCWAAGELTWTELQSALAESGCSQARAEELAAELGL